MSRAQGLKILLLTVCMAVLTGCAFQAPGTVQCGPASGASITTRQVPDTTGHWGNNNDDLDALKRRVDDLEKRLTANEKLAEQANTTAEKALKCCRKEYVTVMTDEIYFDFNKFDLRPESKATLDRIADKLKTDPDLVAEMGGHCDGVGSTDYNIVLGQKRADAARMYLVNSQNINLGRLNIRTFGKDAPAESNDTEQGRAKNRNVTINVLGFAQ